MDFDLKALQSKELLILKEVKRICEKHSIDYFLCFGTLLGAVRHQGFIPWDDDIDIAMTYNNLLKFREVCKNELGNDFFLQNEITEPNAGLTFDKVRMNNTTLIAKNMARRDMHHGIDIDIYPLYSVPDDFFHRKLQLFCAALYMLLEVEEKPVKTSAMMKFFCSFLLFLIRGKIRKGIKRKCHRYMAKFEDRITEYKALLFGNLKYCKTLYPSICFSNIIKMKFENEEFSVPVGYDSFLKTFYGDYMTLPPESERFAKLDNLLKVDTENSYLKYKGVYYCVNNH